jgi:hypothetical protein
MSIAVRTVITSVGSRHHLISVSQDAASLFSLISARVYRGNRFLRGDGGGEGARFLLSESGLWNCENSALERRSPVSRILFSQRGACRFAAPGCPFV